MRGLVLAILLGSSGCGDNASVESNALLAHISAESITRHDKEADKAWPNGASEIAIAAITDDAIVAATLERRPGVFEGCESCRDGRPDCPGNCRQTTIELVVQRADRLPEPVVSIAKVYPATEHHRIRSVDVVVLDRTHAGVAWLDCNEAECRPGLTRGTCTAHYARVDLYHRRATRSEGPLYSGRFGDLQLAYDPYEQQVLAVVSKPGAPRAGVHFAVFDQLGARLLAEPGDPWLSLGSDAASTPAPTATADGFLIFADDPTPDQPSREVPCADACECEAAAPPRVENGGLYAFRPGFEISSERIAGGNTDGRYSRRGMITAIVAGGRAVVASSSNVAEVFSPDEDGWRRRLWSTAPAPRWLGALGDATHLAWLGSEDAGGGGPADQWLVAGVVEGQRDARGVLTAPFDAEVIDTAPLVTNDGVLDTFVMRGRRDANLKWHQVDVVRVHADWQDASKPSGPSPTPTPP